MVWYFPPSAHVHVTHGTWKMESKCEKSERKFPIVGSNKKKTIRWKEGQEKKRKEKKKRNEKKEKKGRKERKERKKNMRKNSCVEEKGERKEKGFDFRYSDGWKLLV